MTTTENNDDLGARAHIDDDKLIELIVMKTSTALQSEIRRREDRRTKRTTLIISIIALVGIGSVTGLANYYIESAVREELKNSLPTFEPAIREEARNIVDEKITEVLSILEENQDFDEYLALVEELAQDEDSFSRELRDAIISKLLQLGTERRITDQKRFFSATEAVIVRFAMADLDGFIDVIDGSIGEVLAKSVNISLDLSDHYGENIIGSPYPVKQLAEQVARVQKYLSTSKTRDYPEKALMWNMFIEFKRAGYQSSPTVDRFVESY